MLDNLIAKGKRAYQQGHYEETAICFKKALEIDPNNINHGERVRLLMIQFMQ